MRVRKRFYGFWNLVLVLSSFAPLFFLWAIQGVPTSTNSEGEAVQLFDSRIFVLTSLMLATLPTVFLVIRFRVVSNSTSKRRAKVLSISDESDHVLVYLLANLVPFYVVDFETWRAFAATLVAVCFVIYIFWALGLSYMNFILPLFGYHIYRVIQTRSNLSLNSSPRLLVVSKAESPADGDLLVLLPFTDRIFFEVEHDRQPHT